MDHAARRVAAVFLAFLASCHVCTTRQITAAVEATVTQDGQVGVVRLSGGAGEANVAGGYDRLEEALRDASAPGVAQTVTFTLEQPPPSAVLDFLAVQLPLPLQRSQFVPVALAGRMGGWGTQDPGPRPAPAGTPADVYLARADFTPSSVSGSLVVLEVDPLRVRLDLHFATADGHTLAIQGDLPFRIVNDEEICGFR